MGDTGSAEECLIIKVKTVGKIKQMPIAVSLARSEGGDVAIEKWVELCFRIKVL